jgi:hypothetical protein
MNLKKAQELERLKMEHETPAAARLYRVLNEKKTKSQFRNELAFLFSLLFWQID